MNGVICDEVPLLSFTLYVTGRIFTATSSHKNDDAASQEAMDDSKADPEARSSFHSCFSLSSRGNLS